MPYNRYLITVPGGGVQCMGRFVQRGSKISLKHSTNIHPFKKKKKDKKLLSFVKKFNIGSKTFETGSKTLLRIKLIQ